MAQISAPPPHTHSYRVPGPAESRAMPHCDHADNEDAMANLHPYFPVLTKALLWRTCTPSCMQTLLQLGPYTRIFELSLHGQMKSFPQVYMLKPKVLYPVAMQTSRRTSRAGKYSNVEKTMCTGLSLSYRAADQLPPLLFSL